MMLIISFCPFFKVSYCFFVDSCFLGEELFKSVDERSESVLKTLWNHSDAITCCSVKVYYFDTLFSCLLFFNL